MSEDELRIIQVNMLNMLKYSKLEYNKYKSTKDIVYLQQAGEKLFNVIEGYISIINKIQIMSFFQAKKLTIQEPSLRRLLYDGRTLHRFFYNALNELDENEACKLYESVLNRIEERVKRL